MLWCKTCGELALYRAERDALPLMRSGKPLAILVHLALIPDHCESRDRITTLFWPQTDDAAAHHALRQALYRLRHATDGDPLLLLDGPHLRFLQGVTLDCLEAERAMASGDAGKVRKLLRGDFLNGLELDRSVEFGEWREGQAARFRELRAQATRDLIQRALRSNDPHYAAELAEELLATNPLREDYVRQVMSALHASGQTPLALTRYAEFVQLLKKSLEDHPSAELDRYAAELNRGPQEHRRLAVAGVTATPAVPPAQIDASRPAHVASGPRVVQSEPGRADRRSRVLENGALALALGIGAVVLAATADLSRAAILGKPPYVRGRLYARPVGMLEAVRKQRLPVYQLAWPRNHRARGAMQVARHWPAGLGPQLVALPVSRSGETHTKIFIIRQRDTIQLTDGDEDDGGAAWSPDRRWIALERGRREGGDYRSNLFVLDSTGRQLWQLTRGLQQDGVLQWSPNGSQLAFLRAERGRAGLWITDIDGGYVEDLSATYSLPTPAAGNVAFSPDGARLAVPHGDGSGLSILDLRRHTSRSLPVSCPIDPGFLAWSPDGKWLAVACRDGVRRSLSIVAPDGLARYDGVADLSDYGWADPAWMEGPPRYVARLQVQPQSPALGARRGQRLSANPVDQAGDPVNAVVRWSTQDTSVASVDQLGFVRGRQPGTTFVVASAGGFRRDSSVVTVAPGGNDTLLYDDWSHGLSPDGWDVVGSPSPLVVTLGSAVNGRALLSNGDYNWPSGVLSRQEFPADEGLTLEVTGSFEFTGDHWQEFEVALVPRARATVGGERAVTGRPGKWWISGPSPEYATKRLACGPDGGDSVWGDSLPLVQRRWYRLAIQVRPDGLVECYFGGRRLGVFEIPGHVRAERLAVYLGGRTYHTRIYHGPVLLTRGLRY